MSGVNYAKVATDESGSTAAGQSNGPLATPPLMKRPYVWGGLLFVVIAAGVLLTSGAAPTPAPAPAADAPPATLRGGAAYPATYSAAASAAAPYASTYSAPRAAPYTAPYTAPYSAPNAAPYAAPSAPYAAPHAPPDSPHAAPASDSAFAALFAENAALRSALAAKPAAADFDIGAYRAERLAATPPNIIECAAATAGASQEACHLSNEKRFQAVGQKGITLWMTGLSGSGKSTIARALEEALVLRYGKHVQMLDGDNVRTGLNRDLGFSPADRAESVRRVGETACLFNGGGVITLVTLVSPYRADRDAARKRHQDQGLAFMEVFMNVPLEIVQDRDPKGLYAKVAAGELKGFTGVDAPYEVPLHADIDLPNWELSLDECVRVLLDKLHVAGVLQGGSTDPSGLPLPPGFVDAWIEDQLILTGKEAYDGRLEAAELPMALLTDIDVNWLHVISEGWAAPLRGFMRQGVLLQSLHFNSVLIDPYDSRGKVNEEATDWESEAHLKQRASLAVPIVLPITAGTRDAILKSGKSAVALVDKDGRILGRLHAPETYPNRKEEIVSRCFGAVDAGHPYISHIYEGGDWLLGGEIELFDKIKYHDGLDEWRLTPKELFGEFKKKGADVVFAFQTRNPTHAGHAYLMRTGRDRLVAKGFKQPVLWLSPLGGWTKSDDVPLDVRVRQHQAVLDEGMLDAKWTVMGIWPAPMIYGGPTEVQFHAASRRAAGASFFVVGRDAAGIKGSDAAVSHADDDMYDANHARFVLQESPVLDDGVMQLLSFDKFFYDKTDHTMKALEASRVDDFISISGSKMRALAAQGAVPCTDPIPNDLLAHNCVPQGFMVPSGWAIVCDYYQNVQADWVPWSKSVVSEPRRDPSTTALGKYGADYALFLNIEGKPASPWHDVPLQAPTSTATQPVFNMVTEIPMFTSAKMEVNKAQWRNPITQDTNSDGSPRYYKYGVPFFNYGLLPQTWEDPAVLSPQGHGGDDDPLDVIELGDDALLMGSVTPVVILASLELIDEGETDHKMLALRTSDPRAFQIKSLVDLERFLPGKVDRLVDWLLNYKTADGKGVNVLANAEKPVTAAAALDIISDCALRWRALTTDESAQHPEFWLPHQAW